MNETICYQLNVLLIFIHIYVHTYFIKKKKKKKRAAINMKYNMICLCNGSVNILKLIVYADS